MRLDEVNNKPVNHEDINLEENKKPLQVTEDSLMAAMQIMNNKQDTAEIDDEDKPKDNDGYTNYEELD
jgi:hypothetical protein